MENQHRQISGYRELNQIEIDLMNEIKAAGQALEQLCDKVRFHVTTQYQIASNGHSEGISDTPEMDRLARAQPETWEGWGRSNFQSGLMYLTRAVAQPGGF
ncbi:hypothetical protein BUE93_21350 [Chromobacterium amazonense]|uniref:Uncharacterized protein n=1 Tax=Chromobacterium amazonense TaxID=1382803 RepID=A0A2S9WYP4_9NEIS|nr:hypothetical protein [Chromobacterium amazonense]PRP68590.1 hypothetical protein BUE93_21350 [Chromobacterium amazonense]